MSDKARDEVREFNEMVKQYTTPRKEYVVDRPSKDSKGVSSVRYFPVDYGIDEDMPILKKLDFYKYLKENQAELKVDPEVLKNFKFEITDADTEKLERADEIKYLFDFENHILNLYPDDSKVPWAKDQLRKTFPGIFDAKKNGLNKRIDLFKKKAVLDVTGEVDRQDWAFRMAMDKDKKLREYIADTTILGSKIPVTKLIEDGKYYDYSKPDTGQFQKGILSRTRRNGLMNTREKPVATTKYTQGAWGRMFGKEPEYEPNVDQWRK